MKTIILIGMKACGKTTVGQTLAQELGVPFIELDRHIEKLHAEKTGKNLTYREIFRAGGEKHFRALETQALARLAKEKVHCILSCGGGTPLSKTNQALLKRMGIVVFLDTDDDILLRRIGAEGIPAFVSDRNHPEKSLKGLMKKRRPIYAGLADMRLAVRDESGDEISKCIAERIAYEH